MTEGTKRRNILRKLGWARNVLGNPGRYTKVEIGRARAIVGQAAKYQTANNPKAQQGGKKKRKSQRRGPR